MPSSMNKPIYGKPVRPMNKPIYGKPSNLERFPQIRNDMTNNGFTPYAAGRKHYGTGRMGPNVGAVADKTGYAMRDGKAAARRQALTRRIGGM